MMNVILDNRVSVSVIKCATSGLTLTISTGNRLSANSGATGITIIRIMEIATKALKGFGPMQIHSIVEISFGKFGLACKQVMNEVLLMPMGR